MRAKSLLFSLSLILLLLAGGFLSDFAMPANGAAGSCFAARPEQAAVPADFLRSFEARGDSAVFIEGAPASSSRRQPGPEYTAGNSRPLGLAFVTRNGTHLPTVINDTNWHKKHQPFYFSEKPSRPHQLILQTVYTVSVSPQPLHGKRHEKFPFAPRSPCCLLFG